MRHALLFATALALAAPAAAQDVAATDATESNAQSLAWHSQQQIYLLGLKPADGWRFIDGGVRWRWTDYKASQEKPTVAEFVTVHYEGKLIDGTVFDSSFARNKPENFLLSRLIPGWQLAITQMGVGESIEVAIPSDLAYGAEGRGPIPPNATLIFKVELLGIGEE